MGTTLIINPGSSSKKFALFAIGTLKQTWHFERTGSGYTVCVTENQKRNYCEDITAAQFNDALSLVLKDLLEAKYVSELAQITAVGIRVVAPATYFTEHRLIDDGFIDQLAALESIAPHHIPNVLTEIKAARKQLPHAIFVGVSDSAFHVTSDPVLRGTGVPHTDAERFDLYRFGYHGISVASVTKHLAVREGMVPRRVIVCHVGSGVSVTAVKNGRSVANSMGYTPASGVMMSSRLSDVSADVLAALMVRKSLSKKDVLRYLYEEGSFAGAVGVRDLRLVLDRAEKNDVAAKEALARFARQVKNHIAMYAMLMDGVDIIVLTATAAERNPTIRHLLVGELPLLHTWIHEARNEALLNNEGYIQTDDSQVKILVLKTDELAEMCRVVDRF